MAASISISLGSLQKNPGVNLNQYFANANSVLQTPAPFTLGTAPQLSQVYSPGARNSDLAIYKNFSLGQDSVKAPPCSFG